MENEMMQKLFSDALGAGMSLLWSLAFLFIGLKLINFLRKIIRRALDRSSVEIGRAHV